MNMRVRSFVTAVGVPRFAAGVAAALLLAFGALSYDAGEARSREPEGRTTHAGVTQLSPVTASTAAAARRRYVFPLRPASVADYSSGGHPYPATDIFAATGTRFVAVTSGVIESINTIDEWDPDIDDPANRGGRWVSLIGDDGIRYYGSHLSRFSLTIAVGDRVAPGQLLGYVGVSGSARHTPPHLHFGISCPSFPEDWGARRGQIDPVPYLDAWAAGRMSSPASAHRCVAETPAGRQGGLGRPSVWRGVAADAALAGHRRRADA